MKKSDPRYIPECQRVPPGFKSPLLRLRPRFSKEQLAYLRDKLTPRCCHVTGMHDPQHFDDQRYVCEGQKAESFDGLRTALGFGKAKAKDAKSKPDCFWCNSEEHHVHVRKRRAHLHRKRRA